MSRYRRLFRNLWIACAVIAVTSAAIGLLVANAASEMLATEDDPEMSVGVLTTSALLLNAAGVFAALWAATFLAYLVTSAMDAGRAEILAAIRAASQDSMPAAPSRSAQPRSGALRSVTAVSNPTDDDPEPSDPGRHSASTFEEFLGRSLLVRGYTATEPPQFRRVEGVLTKDSAGQYWIGNSRVDNLNDTKLEVTGG